MKKYTELDAILAELKAAEKDYNEKMEQYQIKHSAEESKIRKNNK